MRESAESLALFDEPAGCSGGSASATREQEISPKQGVRGTPLPRTRQFRRGKLQYYYCYYYCIIEKGDAQKAMSTNELLAIDFKPVPGDACLSRRNHIEGQKK
jgi:hypothetical protein